MIRSRSADGLLPQPTWHAGLRQPLPRVHNGRHTMNLHWTEFTPTEGGASSRQERGKDGNGRRLSGIDLSNRLVAGTITGLRHTVSCPELSRSAHCPDNQLLPALEAYFFPEAVAPGGHMTRVSRDELIRILPPGEYEKLYSPASLLLRESIRCVHPNTDCLDHCSERKMRIPEGRNGEETWQLRSARHGGD